MIEQTWHHDMRSAHQPHPATRQPFPAPRQRQHRRPGRVDDRAGVETQARAIGRTRVYRPQPFFPRQPDNLRPGLDGCAVCSSVARVEQHQPGVIDPGIGIAIAGGKARFQRHAGCMTAQIDAERIDAEAAVSRLERDNRFLRPILDRDRVVALIAIELTSHGPAFGVYWQTDWLRIPAERLTTQCVLGQRLVGRHKANRDTLTIGLSQGFLADTFSGDRDWHSDIRCPLTTASDIAQHFGYVSLAFITAQDGRWHIDSPLDRREHLDVAGVARQAAHVVRLGHRAANSEQSRPGTGDFHANRPRRVSANIILNTV